MRLLRVMLPLVNIRMTCEYCWLILMITSVMITRVRMCVLVQILLELSSLLLLLLLMLLLRSKHSLRMHRRVIL